MGRSVADNFKKRFGNPERIEIKFEAEKLSNAEEFLRNEAMATAYIDILRNLLEREPTHDESIGKVDIAKKLRKK